MALTSARLQSHLVPFYDAPRWVVAFSGGADSHVLLHLLASLDRHPPLIALHINHGLQSVADEWEIHATLVCEDLQIDFQSVSVAVDAQSGDGIEQAARKARYQAFVDFMQVGDVLMMAHHADDQVETVMLNLLRGGGVAGGKGIPVARTLGAGSLLRPLLESSREQIITYATQHNLEWIEDPSNASLQHDRNYLRHQVLPVIAQRWPALRTTLARSASHAQEAEQLLSELAQQDMSACAYEPATNTLSVTALLNLSEPRRNNVLRQWISKGGMQAPSAAVLEEMSATVLAAAEDATPLVRLQDTEIRRFAGKIWLVPAMPELDTSVQAWDLQSDLVIVGASAVSLAWWQQNLTINAAVEIRFRQGGERCKPRGRSHSQSLKKLLQEYAVPPWLRDRIPLLYLDGQLLAVGEYWVCEI